MVPGPSFGLYVSEPTDTKKPKTVPGPGECSSSSPPCQELPISPDDVALMSPNLINDHDPAQIRTSNFSAITTQILQFPAQLQLSFDHLLTIRRTVLLKSKFNLLPLVTRCRYIKIVPQVSTAIYRLLGFEFLNGL